MSIESDQKRLLQEENLEWVRHHWKDADGMVTVCRYNPQDVLDDNFIWCGLIPSSQSNMILSEERIYDVIENMWPEPAAYCPPGENKVKYFRWGVEENQYGAEPLVIGRVFGDKREKYFEISEEFRLFHNLYHNKDTDTYINVNNEEIIAVISDNEVRIRLKEIRQFLAVKEMDMSILFEFNEYSKYSVDELWLGDKPRGFKSDNFIYWAYDRIETSRGEFLSNSRLRGRKRIQPVPKSQSGFGDFVHEPE